MADRAPRPPRPGEGSPAAQTLYALRSLYSALYDQMTSNNAETKQNAKNVVLASVDNLRGQIEAL